MLRRGVGNSVLIVVTNYVVSVFVCLFKEKEKIEKKMGDEELGRVMFPAVVKKSTEIVFHFCVVTTCCSSSRKYRWFGEKFAVDENIWAPKEFSKLGSTMEALSFAEKYSTLHCYPLVISLESVDGNSYGIEGSSLGLALVLALFGVKLPVGVCFTGYLHSIGSTTSDPTIEPIDKLDYKCRGAEERDIAVVANPGVMFCSSEVLIPVKTFNQVLSIVGIAGDHCVGKELCRRCTLTGN